MMYWSWTAFLTIVCECCVKLDYFWDFIRWISLDEIPIQMSARDDRSAEIKMVEFWYVIREQKEINFFDFRSNSFPSWYILVIWRSLLHFSDLHTPTQVHQDAIEVTFRIGIWNEVEALKEDFQMLSGNISDTNCQFFCLKCYIDRSIRAKMSQKLYHEPWSNIRN